jgi:hypothetical protein
MKVANCCRKFAVHAAVPKAHESSVRRKSRAMLPSSVFSPDEYGANGALGDTVSPSRHFDIFSNTQGNKKKMYTLLQGAVVKVVEAALPILPLAVVDDVSDNVALVAAWEWVDMRGGYGRLEEFCKPRPPPPVEDLKEGENYIRARLYFPCHPQVEDAALKVHLRGHVARDDAVVTLQLRERVVPVCGLPTENKKKLKNRKGSQGRRRRRKREKKKKKKK